MIETIETLTLKYEQVIEELELYSVLVKKLNLDIFCNSRNDILHKLESQNDILDAKYYIETYPDVALSGLSATEHYNKYGKILGRSKCKV